MTLLTWVVLLLTIGLFFYIFGEFLNFETMVYYIETVKCLFSYSFYRTVFLLHTGINYDITHLACAFFTGYFNFWRIFEILK